MKNKFRIVFLLLVGTFLSACHDDDFPPIENQEETITLVRLEFQNKDNSSDLVIAQWSDPDGEGNDPPTADLITLQQEATYVLHIFIQNTLATPAEDITEEVMEESDEHQLFFSFTNGLFADPAGDGNIDQYDDPLIYSDQDENGLPLGLMTTWTTSEASMEGEFHVLLKHQPDIKSANSTATQGETDVDVTFPFSVK